MTTASACGEDWRILRSRLLPRLLGAERLEKLGAPRILDFGRANADSLSYFGNHPCRLQVLDAADALQSLAARPRDADSQPATPDDFAALFGELAGQRFDIVLLWDCINILPLADLPAFFRFLGEHLHDGCRGHGFILHKRTVEPRLRHFGVAGEDVLRLIAEQPMTLHLHNRKAINEAMVPLTIEHAVLHGDGRQEILFG
ncbi:hypothetical protein [Pseudohaliea rubra]|uniref:SAM-dependent methyltransferase n=1 Tax=Pseudohaliea rubra DSM 19751 TaxID=1265313 RepID=A0A095XU06_9GAMM|nr:hypothetical protein [Pseudohaliea rubra]KGE03126.1 hypothetical protein HRUBRA_02358 [Pseudohaliea rubra DSM 19751]